MKHIFMPTTNVIYNDNQACVNWSKKCTTMGLHHIQMKENRVRENVASDLITIKHVDGKVNIADIFTKEKRSQLTLWNYMTYSCVTGLLSSMIPLILY